MWLIIHHICDVIKFRILKVSLSLKQFFDVLATCGPIFVSLAWLEIEFWALNVLGGGATPPPPTRYRGPAEIVDLQPINQHFRVSELYYVYASTNAISSFLPTCWGGTKHMRLFVTLSSLIVGDEHKMFTPPCLVLFRSPTAKFNSAKNRLNIHTKNEEMNMFPGFQLNMTFKRAKMRTPIILGDPSRKWGFHKRDEISFSQNFCKKVFI